MFTGIVTDIGEIASLTPTAQGQLHRLRIACRYDRATIADGASMACHAVCPPGGAAAVAGGTTWCDGDAAAARLDTPTVRQRGQQTGLRRDAVLSTGADDRAHAAH